MKFLIVSEPSSKYVTSRLQEEAQRRGHHADIYHYPDLVLSYQDRFTLSFNAEPIARYDVATLRVVQGSSMVFHKDVLARHLTKQGTYVLNGESFIDFPYLGKLTQTHLLHQAGLPVIQSYLFARPPARTELDQFTYPVIVKKSFGRLGLGIQKINDAAELEQYLSEGSSKYLIQRFLTTSQDYRVFVVGDRVLPKVMKKTAPPGKYITNYSQGGIVTSESLTEELEDLALRAAQVFGADYAGVDIMYDESGKPHILEINRNAHFKGFESATSLNVAEYTVKYLETKAKK